MRAAVLGSPIAHSLSPALHRAAYRELGLDWSYDAIEVTEGQLADFIGDLDPSWAGLSLTMPLKEAVLSLLDEIDEDARAVRSVNTVLPFDGGWCGRNTDIDGIVAALNGAGCGTARTATVLGAGATARSAVAALHRLGVTDLNVCARRPDAARDVAAVAETFGLSVTTTDFTPATGLVEADVVICTVPGDAGAPWAAVADRGTGVLLDAAYHPWPTPMASAWGGSGLASGRDMLLWQAVEQVRLMTGQPAPVAAMRAALPAP